jgi:hypothetical protein
MDWMADQPTKHKVFIAGNHDFPAYDSPVKVKEYAENKGLY